VRRVIAALVPLFLVACGGGASGSSTSGHELTVFAASSLTAAFTQLASTFERADPGVHVTLNFGSSTDLAAQIGSEGTADVFASANGAAMDTVAADPGVLDRGTFATNELVVITPPDNPAGVSRLDDLATPGIQLVIGAEGVPVGDYARQMLRNAGIDQQVLANVVSNEPNDASIVAKVASGEVDAAIVYTSDIAAAKASVASVAVPAAVNVTATYPIAAVEGGDTELAGAFVAYVRGPDGQALLRTYGFGPAV
jgi:molybdate transport system substrate-binding protein